MSLLSVAMSQFLKFMSSFLGKMHMVMIRKKINFYIISKRCFLNLHWRKNLFLKKSLRHLIINYNHHTISILTISYTLHLHHNHTISILTISSTLHLHHNHNSYIDVGCAIYTSESWTQRKPRRLTPNIHLASI